MRRSGSGAAFDQVGWGARILIARARSIGLLMALAGGSVDGLLALGGDGTGPL